MDINLNQLKKAVDRLRLEIPHDLNPKLSVVARTEDFDKGVLGEVITISLEYEKEPSYQDNVETKVIITKTLEVFPASENRNSIMVTQERREFK